MKAMKFLLSGLLTVCIMAACDKDDDEKLNDTDRNFLMQAGYANSAEINAGNLASTKAVNPAVKAFGQMMVSEHGTSHAELNAIGTERGVDVPDEPDPPHQALAQRLATLQGVSFDTAFMNSQVMDHQMTVQLFENEIANGRHWRVKEYANKYLPHIRMHLQKADSLARAIR
ncbi:MAG TPA: DUF4142 domain-containing protein [Chitinophagaceae bacterium]|nr:DUF4142 domain-containing protein [Chitinophagaceae bacterium]